MMHLRTLPSFFEIAHATDNEPFDERSVQLNTLLDNENFDEAIPIIEQIFKEGRLDIGLVMHLINAFFLKEGVRSFLDAFPSLISLIQDHWERISPIEQRESRVSKSTDWLFSTIVRRMKRSSDLKKTGRLDPLWKNTCELPLQTLEEIESKSRELIDFFIKKWKQPSCLESLQYLINWLREMKGYVREKTPAAEVHEIDEKIEDIEPEIETFEEPEKKEISVSPTQVREKPLNPIEALLLSSPKMQGLHDKIQLFESLIENGDYRKSAMIADEIQHQVENFDPTQFFPKIFSNYLALLAKHIDTFTDEWQNKGTPQWDSLEKLYRTDLDAFVNW